MIQHVGWIDQKLGLFFVQNLKLNFWILRSSLVVVSCNSLRSKQLQDGFKKKVRTYSTFYFQVQGIHCGANIEVLPSLNVVHLLIAWWRRP
jgi:hypothetical protein